MSSMKRNFQGRSRVKRATSSGNSASLTPAIGTQLNLTSRSPVAAMASMPSSTRAKNGRRVSSVKEAALSVSRLMLTPVSPACTRSSAMSASRTPFVVSATDSMPGTERISRTSSTTFRRMSGSPPVSRTLRTPSEASARTMRTISSKRRMSSCRSFSTPSSGMQ